MICQPATQLPFHANQLQPSQLNNRTSKKQFSRQTFSQTFGYFNLHIPLPGASPMQHFMKINLFTPLFSYLGGICACKNIDGLVEQESNCTETFDRKPWGRSRMEIPLLVNIIRFSCADISLVGTFLIFSYQIINL